MQKLCSFKSTQISKCKALFIIIKGYTIGGVVLSKVRATCNAEIMSGKVAHIDGYVIYVISSNFVLQKGQEPVWSVCIS